MVPADLVRYRPPPMRRTLLLLPALATLAACGSSASVDRLTVDDAWARTTPPGATNGVVYFTITSPADVAITDVLVDAAVAAAAELHETMGGGTASPMANMPEMAEDGEMEMVPVDSVAIAADDTVAFEPGGKHVMLTGLVTPLVAGDTFTLTLQMSDGATLPVTVVIADNDPAG